MIDYHNKDLSQDELLISNDRSLEKECSLERTNILFVDSVFPKFCGYLKFLDMYFMTLESDSL